MTTQKEQALNEIKQIEQNVQQMTTRLDELKKIVSQPDEPKGLWVPEKGEEFYWVDSLGGVYKGTYSGHSNDHHRKNIGNYFKTRADAERHVKKLQVTQRLRELAGGFKPDWSGDSQTKYCICKNYNTGKVDFGWVHQASYAGTVYFETRESVQNAIKIIGDDLHVLFD